MPTRFSRLRKISDRSPAVVERRMMLILDTVQYHHARLYRNWRDNGRGQFVLEFMSRYSPELNPIERSWWKLTRRKATHNRYIPALYSVRNSVKNVFDGWHKGNVALKRLCALLCMKNPLEIILLSIRNYIIYEAFADERNTYPTMFRN
jgi:transposase